jgi:TolB-like protein
LGVLLYELIAQRRPYNFDSKSPYEIVQAICEEPPIRPSSLAKHSLLATYNDGLKHDKQQTIHNKLQAKSLLGDLDNIILKALRKEPERRYASIGEFSEDVRRYLEGLPVVARKDSLAYHCVKYFERNRRASLLVLAISILCLLLGASFVLFTNRAKPRSSIAVVPFTNSSKDADMEYLSDGITDKFIQSLARVPNLKVPGRGSVFRYKDQAQTPYIIGNDLGVETILTGNVTSDGENLAIQVSLLETKTNQPIWSDLYIGKPADIMAMQEQIIRDVVDGLGIKAEIKEQQLQKSYTKSADAYRLYLKGRYFWNKRSGENVYAGIFYFKKAIEKDPNYALAYSGVADCNILLSIYGTTSHKESFAQARADAQKALELDNDLAEAHVSLAAVKWMYDWEWEGADRHFRRAIEINPNYPTAHHWYGLYLAEMGRFDEAMAEAKMAVKLDPLSVIINADLGRVLYYSRRYNESLEQFKKAMAMDSPTGGTAFDITFVYEQMGMSAEWFSAMEHFEAVTNQELRTAYLESGIKGFWRKRLELRQILSLNGYPLAEEWARIGEKDKAFEMLNKAYEDRSFGMAQLKVNPVFDPLRSDPRFAELLRRMNLDN